MPTLTPAKPVVKEISGRQPLYEVVRERLRQECLSRGGEGMLPSLRQLSADLSVNHLTVSRALRDLENDGIVEIVPRKGIFVRSGSPAGVEIVTLLSPEQNLTEISCQMYRGMQSVAGAGRVGGTTLTVPPFPAANEFAATLKARGTGAIVLLGFGYLDQASGMAEANFIHELAELLPVVLVGKEHPLLKLDCVYCDPRHRMLEALEACYQRGHRRFGYLGSQVELPHFKERFEAFREFLWNHNLTGQREHTPADGPTSAATAAALLDTSPQPQVVVAANLSRAYSLVLEAQRRGLTLGQDLEVLCFASSSDEARSLAPYVNIILLDEAAVGRVAMERLQQRLKNKESFPPQTITVSAQSLLG